MKKYKLKRWYPSLDSRWEVEDIAHYYRNGAYWNGTRMVKNGVSAKEVENNPDFWELIEEEKPLFITEDGVEVFDRDEYFAIGYDFNKRNMIAYNCDAPYSTGVIRFKHESNADEYIWRNKPLFSYHEIWKYAPYGSPLSIFEHLAKERSNQ